jgi:hypothetical protein
MAASRTESEPSKITIFKKETLSLGEIFSAINNIGITCSFPESNNIKFYGISGDSMIANDIA